MIGYSKLTLHWWGVQITEHENGEWGPLHVSERLLQVTQVIRKLPDHQSVQV